MPTEAMTLENLADAFADVEVKDRIVRRVYMNRNHLDTLVSVGLSDQQFSNSDTCEGVFWGAEVYLKEDLPDGYVVLISGVSRMNGGDEDLKEGWIPDPTQLVALKPKRRATQKKLSQGMTPKLRVVIESPLKGDYERNRKYAKACMRDSLARGEAPYASHLLYAQPGILDDTDAEERKTGMEAGFAWGAAAELVAVYQDLGISDGMQKGIDLWESMGTTVERRNLPPEILASIMTPN